MTTLILILLALLELAVPERLTYTVEEAGRLLGISRNSAYECVRRGEIPSIRLKGRIVVPKAALERLLAGATADEPEAVAQ